MHPILQHRITPDTSFEDNLELYVMESCAIEGYKYTKQDLAAHKKWLFSNKRLKDLEVFVNSVAGKVYLPKIKQKWGVNSLLRTEEGMDVFIGNHTPPRGGKNIKPLLESIMNDVRCPLEQHQFFQTLHPFLDGNGRAGRAIWLARRGAMRPFLQDYYYQSLSVSDGRKT